MIEDQVANRQWIHQDILKANNGYVVASDYVSADTIISIEMDLVSCKLAKLPAAVLATIHKKLGALVFHLILVVRRQSCWNYDLTFGFGLQDRFTGRTTKTLWGTTVASDFFSLFLHSLWIFFLCQICKNENEFDMIYFVIVWYWIQAIVPRISWKQHLEKYVEGKGNNKLMMQKKLFLLVGIFCE